MSDEIYSQLVQKIKSNPSLRGPVLKQLQEKGKLGDFKNFLVKQKSQAIPATKEPVDNSLEHLAEAQTPMADRTQYSTGLQDIAGERSKGMITPTSHKWKTTLSPTGKTLENISSVYPVVENALQLATSTYGLPASGIAGLMNLIFTGDLDKATKVINKTQELLIHQPKLGRSKELQQTIAEPMQMLSVPAEKAGEYFEDKGMPNVAATVHSAIEAAPVLLTGGKLKSTLKKVNPVKIKEGIKNTVTKDLPKVLKPGIKGRKSYKQKVKADNQAATAIETIVRNKEDLKFNREGFDVKGKLPETLDEALNSIDQTKSKLFKEYDRLAKATDNEKLVSYERVKWPLVKNESRKIVVRDGEPYFENIKDFRVNTKSIIPELEKIIEHKPTRTANQTVAKYALDQIDEYKDKKFTATETQELIQILNQSTKKFHLDPSKETMGIAKVDALIANHLRKNLQEKIKKAGGAEYQTLKRQYGALKSIEEDMARSVNNYTKKMTGLPSFSDVVAGHQIISGLATQNLGSVLGGAFIKGAQKVRQFKSEPNKRIAKMFKDVDKKVALLEEHNRKMLHRRLK